MCARHACFLADIYVADVFLWQLLFCDARHRWIVVFVYVADKISGYSRSLFARHTCSLAVIYVVGGFWGRGNIRKRPLNNC